MRREQVVDRILALNPGANLEFLAVFSDASLRQYLDHLSLVERGRGSVWVRPENMPTMVARMNMS